MGRRGIDDNDRRRRIAPFPYGPSFFQGSAQMNIAPVARLKAALQDRLRKIARGADIYVRRSQQYAKGLKRIG